MGYFGEERVSVAPTRPSEYANEAIQRALHQLQNNTNNTGGILHFPVGVFRVRATSTPADAAIVFPPGVTLRFDEGAVLDVAANAYVEIGGSIDAGPHTIFQTVRDGWWAGEPLMPAPVVGQVVFTGKTYARIIPEWWGAGRGNAAQDTHALQSALNAGFADRIRHIGAGYVVDPPIPVELVGSYEVERTLVIDASPQGRSVGGAESFMLRGTRSLESVSATDPTLGWAGIFESGPILQSKWAFGISIENLFFDGRGQVGICLILQSGQRRGGTAAQMPQVRDCLFRGATDALVHLGGDLVSESAPGDSSQDLLNPSFVRCSFEVTSTHAFLRPVGLRLNAAETFGVLVSRCSFFGEARALIHAYSGAIVLDGCRFDNRAPNTNVQGEGPNGVDVYLDVLAARIVPAGMTVMNCESWSAQFIGSSNRDPMGAPLWHTTILGFKHHFDPTAVDAPVVPVIYWANTGRTSTDAEGGHSLVLLLGGCSFNSYVQLNAADSTVVADFASNFADSVLIPFIPALSGDSMTGRLIQLHNMAVLR